MKIFLNTGRSTFVSKYSKRQTLSAKGKTVLLWWRNLTDITLTKCSRFTSNKIYHTCTPDETHWKGHSITSRCLFWHTSNFNNQKVPDNTHWVAFYNVTVDSKYQVPTRLKTEKLSQGRETKEIWQPTAMWDLQGLKQKEAVGREGVEKYEYSL